jgi:hypothetical protein
LPVVDAQHKQPRLGAKRDREVPPVSVLHNRVLGPEQDAAMGVAELHCPFADHGHEAVDRHLENELRGACWGGSRGQNPARAHGGLVRTTQ